MAEICCQATGADAQVLLSVSGVSDKLVTSGRPAVAVSGLVCTQLRHAYLKEGAEMWGVESTGFPC